MGNTLFPLICYFKEKYLSLPQVRNQGLILQLKKCMNEKMMDIILKRVSITKQLELWESGTEITLNVSASLVKKGLYIYMCVYVSCLFKDRNYITVTTYLYILLPLNYTFLLVSVFHLFHNSTFIETQ